MRSSTERVRQTGGSVLLNKCSVFIPRRDGPLRYGAGGSFLLGPCRVAAAGGALLFHPGGFGARRAKGGQALIRRLLFLCRLIASIMPIRASIIGPLFSAASLTQRAAV